MAAPYLPTIKRITRRRMVYVYPWGWQSQIYYTYTRLGTNQKPPYIDTSLTVDVGRALSDVFDASSWSFSPEDSDAAIKATNDARAKFVSKLGDSSSFGATLTSEAKSSWATVSGGVTNALLAANAVRRGRLKDAAKILGFYPPEKVIKRSKGRKKLKDGTYRKRLVTTRVWVMPDGKQVSKSLGNKWLWYSYGVAPLVSDIHNGMDVLTRECPSTRVTGSGRHAYDLNVGGFYQTRYKFVSSVRISANVRVNNPNLWLANQLGLINPVQMFIEGVRLSFVADWFSNLSQIVSQMTDFVGLDITRPITTSKHVGQLLQLHPDYGHRMDGERTIITRRTVVPEARLRFAYERFSWQRGLNAISLLVGVLRNAR